MLEDFWASVNSNGVLWGFIGVAAFFLLIAILKIFIKVTSSDQIIVVNGRKKKINDKTFGFSIERGRTNILPFFEEAQYLDLNVFPINVRVEGVNSANGITVGADATACVCIDDDDSSMLYAAVEKLMGKSRKEIQEQIQQTLIGNFRGALNKATPLQAIGMEDVHVENETGDESDRAQFRHGLLEDINNDLSSFGMKVVSVSLQNIWDSSSYIANLAQKTLAQKRQEVEIEEARLKAKADQIESDGIRRVTIAKNKAEESIIAAQQKYEVTKKECEAQIHKAKLEADSSINEAVNRGQKEIETLKIELQKLKNQSGVILEAKARQKEAEIHAEGLSESTKILEEAKNSILKKKMDLFQKAGNLSKMVLFIKKIDVLFDAYKDYAKDITIDSMVVMDEANGLNNAVNRGPQAFGDFLRVFNESTGISIRDLLNPVSGGERSGK